MAASSRLVRSWRVLFGVLACIACILCFVIIVGSGALGHREPDKAVVAAQGPVDAESGDGKPPVASDLVRHHERSGASLPIHAPDTVTTRAQRL